MKRTLSLILALVMCLGLYACGNNGTTKITETNEFQTTEPPKKIETVSMKSLINDLGNGARAQLNVGKSTTVIGKVAEVTSEFCAVQFFDSPRYIFKVILPLEVLAELYSGKFVAITAIVDSVDTGERDILINTSENLGKVKGNNTYFLKGDAISDSELISTYISDKIALINNNYTDAESYYNRITNCLDLDLLKSYLYGSDGKSFCTLKDDELKNYLTGEWLYDTGFYSNTYDFKNIELKDDGTYMWQQHIAATPKELNWSVDETKLVGYRDGSVYILSEDAFICSGYLYVRVK